VNSACVISELFHTGTLLVSLVSVMVVVVA